jgi:hypothetical protein
MRIESLERQIEVIRAWAQGHAEGYEDCGGFLMKPPL